MASRHTPGPWQARFLYRLIRAGRESPGLLVESPPENDWADATLMAASPRLLAGLKRDAERFRGFAGHCRDCGWDSLGEEFDRFAAECETDIAATEVRD